MLVRSAEDPQTARQKGGMAHTGVTRVRSHATVMQGEILTMPSIEQVLDHDASITQTITLVSVERPCMMSKAFAHVALVVEL